MVLYENCFEAYAKAYKDIKYERVPFESGYLPDVTLIGISLGGYLATRAAAFEPRISKLVMYDLIYDFMAHLELVWEKLVENFLTF